MEAAAWGLDPEVEAARVAADQVGRAAQAAAEACGRPGNRALRPAVAARAAEQGQVDLAVEAVEEEKVAVLADQAVAREVVPEVAVLEVGPAADLEVAEADSEVAAVLVEVAEELAVAPVRQANPASG